MEGTTLDWLIRSAVAIIGILVMPIATLWYKNYLDKKDKKPHNVSVAVAKNKALETLCDELKTKLSAQRVNISLFHNGGYYYTGEPIQKLSMICEMNEEMVTPIIHLFQNQPIGIFQRNLEKLTKEDYFFEYNELKYNDSLSVINGLYHIASSALFKLKNKDGYFSGILTINYSNHHSLTTGEIEIIKENCAQIEKEMNKHIAK